MTPEQLIVRYINTGDETYFRALHDRYAEPLLGWLRSRDERVADETAATTWENVWKRCETWQPGNTFSTWLYRIARYAAIDIYRCEARRLHVGFPDLVLKQAKADRVEWRFFRSA
jgi:DNA-directed RNA polymerase specialized sigma24 family protein